MNGLVFNVLRKVGFWKPWFENFEKGKIWTRSWAQKMDEKSEKKREMSKQDIY